MSGSCSSLPVLTPFLGCVEDIRQFSLPWSRLLPKLSFTVLFRLKSLKILFVEREVLCHSKSQEERWVGTSYSITAAFIRAHQYEVILLHFSGTKH